MGNVYFKGHKQVKLTRRHLPAKWDDAESTLRAMNLAFEIYYRGIKAGIEADGDEIWFSVRDSGTDGSSTWLGNLKRGKEVPDDLHEAFHYLHKRWPFSPHETKHSWWGETQRQTYSGDLIEGSVKVPRSIYYFLSSVEGKMKTVGSTLRSWTASTRMAMSQHENEDWENLGKTLKSVNSKAKVAKHFLWLVPPKWQRGPKFSMSFAKASEDIHKFATLLVDKGLERAVLETLAINALGRLPVLGQFYVAAIETFPAILRGYKGLVNCQVRILDSAGNGRNFRHPCRENNRSY